MRPTGNERPASIPAGPYASFPSVPQAPYGHLVGSNFVGVPQQPTHPVTSASLYSSQRPGYFPTMQQHQPAIPAQSAATTVPFHPSHVPLFPAPAQPTTPLPSPHLGPPPIAPGGSFHAPTVPSVPTIPATMFSPQLQSGGVTPPPVSPFLAPHGRPLPSGTTLPSQISNLPPIAAPGLTSQMQFSHMGPPGPPTGGALQALVEDFESLSVSSVPGSLDTGINVKSLPRPLDCDEEPIKIAESFPLNCHPRFFRLTTHAIPSSQSLLSRWHLPLGAIVHPLATASEGEVPIINFGSMGVIRCRRCRTYINPYVAFADSGRKWRCNVCSLLNDVPGEYFCALDASGKRLDTDQRPELSKGTVEFVAPAEYMVRPPMPPSYFFLIDVSVNAVQSGLLEIVATTIKSCLDELPGFPRTQIGFITFDSTLHFHNLKATLSQPQMMVVTDLDDVFLPVPDDLLVNLVESRHVVESFLDSLPNMFTDTGNVESALGPALKAAFMVMSQIGGKLLVFQSTLPSLGIGRLRLRGDDVRAYGTDKEHTLRVPEDVFYKNMAADFTKNQIGVDIYALGNQFCDIASLGSLAKYTGGQVYYYPSFQAATHKEKLRHELERNLTRETAWEAVMRIRCGKGVRFTSYHGHFMLRSTDLLALPAVDSDKAFGMQLALEETLMTTQTTYFQVALLYTSSSGERRIRVHTAAAHVVSDLTEMYRQADVGAMVCLLTRLVVEHSLSHKLEDARQFAQLKLVKSFKEYRNLHAVQHRVAGKLIYPESLRFLPLYILSLLKAAAICGGYADISLDERCASGFAMMILPVKRLLKLLYPALYRIDGILTQGSNNFERSLTRLAPSIQSLDQSGLYILDDGSVFTIWFGKLLPNNVSVNILGINPASSPDLSKVHLPEWDNEISKRMALILDHLRGEDPTTYQLARIMRQGEQPREAALFLSRLVEDQAPTGSAAGGSTGSYSDWVLQLYRQTQS